MRTEPNGCRCRFRFFSTCGWSNPFASRSKIYPPHQIHDPRPDSHLALRSDLDPAVVPVAPGLPAERDAVSATQQRPHGAPHRRCGQRCVRVCVCACYDQSPTTSRVGGIFTGGGGDSQSIVLEGAVPRPTQDLFFRVR